MQVHIPIVILLGETSNRSHGKSWNLTVMFEEVKCRLKTRRWRVFFGANHDTKHSTEDEEPLPFEYFKMFTFVDLPGSWHFRSPVLENT